MKTSASHIQCDACMCFLKVYVFFVVLESTDSDNCRPECTQEFCQANPTEICSARWHNCPSISHHTLLRPFHLTQISSQRSPPHHHPPPSLSLLGLRHWSRRAATVPASTRPAPAVWSCRRRCRRAPRCAPPPTRRVCTASGDACTTTAHWHNVVSWTRTCRYSGKQTKL